MTMETFDSSTTWTCPADVTSVQVEGYGGSGGGCAGATEKACYSGGGGGGAYSKVNAFVSTPGNNYTVTIGAAGVGGSASFGSSGTSG